MDNTSYYNWNIRISFTGMRYQIIECTSKEDQDTMRCRIETAQFSDESPWVEWQTSAGRLIQVNLDNATRITYNVGRD